MSIVLIHNRRKEWNTITDTYVTNIIMKDETGPDMLTGRTLLLLIMYCISTRWLVTTPARGTKFYWYTSTQYRFYHILRIYDTVHKGISKLHITDEKPPILRCAFLHWCLILFLIIPLHPATFQKTITPLHSAPFQKRSGMSFENIYKYWSRNMHHNFISFLGFGSYPRINISHNIYKYWCTIEDLATKFSALLSTPWIKIIYSGRLSSSYTKVPLLFSYNHHI